ncbi:hypothetical protein ACTFIZ_005937 [Dictyostelium cf. discoideum]
MSLLEQFDSFDKIFNSNDRLFRSLFWIDKNTFFFLQTKLKNINVKLKDLLLYLHFLKCYHTLDQLQIYHKLSSKTILKRINNVKKNLLLLTEINPLNCGDRLSQIPLIIDGIKIYSVIDTTLFNIQKPTDFQDVYYSPKHKRHGIKLEVVCNVSDGKIIWVSNEFYGGSEHDITISRHSGLVDGEFNLEEDEKILADKGYLGEDIFYCPKRGDRENLSELEKSKEKIVLPYRQMIENVFSKLKVCKILSDRFRGKIEELDEHARIIIFIFNIWILFNPMRANK